MKIDCKIDLYTLATVNSMWIHFQILECGYVASIEKSILQKLQKDFINKMAQRIGKKDKPFTISLYKHEAEVLEKYIRTYRQKIWVNTSLEIAKTTLLLNHIQPQLL